MATFTGVVPLAIGASRACLSTLAIEILAGVCAAWVVWRFFHGSLLYVPDETQADSSKDALMINMAVNIEDLRIYLLLFRKNNIKISRMNIEDIEKLMLNPDSNIILKSGLYIVATPIGNLRDISLRALDVLQNCDVIMCEDTRVTKKLLNAYQIKARLYSYNDHSDNARRVSIIEQIKDGGVIALVSDAGMPLISDPGYKLVCDARKADIYVTTIPGANAPLAALQISGMPSDQFCFLGFLPHKKGARIKMLEPWKRAPATLICFTAAPRLMASIEDIEFTLGGREIAVVREITKMYEEVRKGFAADLLAHYEERGLPKGEIVLVIAPPDDTEFSEEAVCDMIRDALESMRTKEAASFVADITGLKKNDLYNIALGINNEK